MQKNKLVQLLRTLTAEEMRQLDKFVRSPIHNKHEAVIQLFQYLRKSLADEGKLQKEKVFHSLFPGQPFDMQQVHYVSSYLLKVTENFLAWQDWQKDETSVGLYLMRAYGQRRLEHVFEQIWEKTLKSHEAQPFRDARFYTDSYRLRQEEYNHARRLRFSQEINLQALADVQDIAFLADKLKVACILQSHQTISKTTYEPGLLNAALAFLENHPYLQIPSVAIYFHAYRALSNMRDDESFRHLKSLLFKHRNQFDINELHDIYIFAINYCVRRLNSGEKAFMWEVFDIYQSGLEIDIFLERGILAPRTYSNIVMSGLRLGEFEWVETFIFKYKEKLPEKEREGFFNYNLAQFYYEKGNFKAAMPLLLQIGHEDVLHTCSAKTLLAKMYFELREWESLLSLLQSFKVFLRRKSMLGYHREGYLNFIHFLSRLMQNQPASFEQFQKELAKTKSIPEKEWLLEQASK